MKWKHSLLILTVFSILVSYGKSHQSIEDLTNWAREKRSTSSQNKTKEINMCYAPDIIKYHGYAAEIHTVETEDGYILTMHRVLRNLSNSNRKSKCVVLIQHGLTGCSDEWLRPGPNRSLAYILVDRGCDVWLSNSRGNKYSRKHKTLDPDKDSKFWDFSWHEIGKFDLPAIIDYILEKTGKKKINYVGHSQGTTIPCVLLSERPEYNDKFLILILLAAVQYIEPVVPFSIPGLSFMNSITNSIFSIITYSEMKPKTDCKNNKESCKNAIFSFAGKSEELYDPEIYDKVFECGHAGASSKQFIHYGQSALSGKFQQFNYGVVRNVKTYRSIYPPDYNISNIKAPITMIVSTNDKLTTARQAKKMFDQLPNKKDFIVLKWPYNHMDFLFSTNVQELNHDIIDPMILNSDS